ncbi:MAG: Hsp70 family protein [Owenweeksia sp.]|nr:Hsp70 family protein [Owenweeksia sp.]
MTLQKMKKAAEDYLGQEVTEAVVTVPAYFNDSQRQATKEAGEIAGLTVAKNYRRAYSRCFGLRSLIKRTKIKRLPFTTCGGGTLDVSVLELGDGVFEVTLLPMVIPTWVVMTSTR